MKHELLLKEEISKNFNKLIKLNKSYIAALKETGYGSSFELNAIKNYKDWQSILPIINPEIYVKVGPSGFIRTDKDNPKESMIALPSGGTTGLAKQTYWTQADVGVVLSPDVETNIAQAKKANKPFIFVSELKETTSFKIMKGWAKQRGYKFSFKGFDDLSEFVDICNSSKSNVFLTLQVSSARALFSEISKYQKNSPKLFKNIKSLDHLYFDLNAEPVAINELSQWYTVLRNIFDVKPVIAVTYAATESKLIGLYIYKPGDKEIKYKVRDGLFVELIDPDSGDSNYNDGNIVLTDFTKRLGSLYPRYDTGDRANIIFENEKCFLYKVNRDPSRGQINLRGNKMYTQVFYNAIQKLVGDDLPIIIQYQLLNSSKGDYSILNIDIGGNNFTDKQLNKIKIAVIEFMDDDDGYKFLTLGGGIKKEGELYYAPKLEIRFNYIKTLKWKNQKAYRRLPDSDLESFAESAIKDKMLTCLTLISNFDMGFPNSVLPVLPIREMIKSIPCDELYDYVRSGFFESELWQKFIQKTQDFNFRFEIADEKELNELSKTQEGKVFVGKILSTTKYHAKQEILLSEINEGENICFVGCGSIPISAIVYKQLGMQLTTIDIDPEAIINAKKFAESENSSIDIICADAFKYDYDQFDAVIIAGMISNKDYFIEKFKTKYPDKKLVARIPIERAECLYPPCTIKPNKLVKIPNDPLAIGIF